MIFAENQVGFHFTPSYEDFEHPFNKIIFKKLVINAIARLDCPQCYQNSAECSNLVGAEMTGHNRLPKDWPPKNLWIDVICKD